ncbi:MAG: nuclear transport factor 2 family protein [Acidobacteriota bacterium]|nr:MAG: nuclear transport factor 2 family protein [Acidobacteriota bacterium]
MRKLFAAMMAGALAISFTACEQAANKPANTTNTNANAAKPAAAAPTAASLLEQEKKAHAAWLSGDTAWFTENLSDKFVSYHNGQRFAKLDEVKMVADAKCEGKDTKLDEEQLVKINDDTYAIVYRSSTDAECTVGGQKMKVPSPTRAATIWVREGDKWKGAFHSETPIIDPKNPPAAPAKTEAKKEEPKKDEPAKDAELAKKEEMNKPQPSANTDALTKAHNGGWEAWRTKDAKWFNDTLTASAAYVDAFGVLHSGKDALVKLWIETDAANCEGITKTSFSESMASAWSPTVEVLTGKGSADGKCGGQPNGPLYQTAVYVKEGDAWKLAFMMSQRPM